ncbi:NFACT RNA binding domain-containing protein [Paenibacillus sp. UMB4589-SE434]|uniref:Rqc2 family fibronectin-binding protein n=1 Tax=Paenibacillus sp. UMB4589-SE434 TaxID=3046314 RepID=UPI00254C2044|nr:NFACT RNA binding domain-containing protein [Paenibacillus sp. UMB4589-SE434]MDK8180848.1 NFACT RNA binding domain-containing protein [Paenibacillus sp. UMB4589-SE434]
MSLDGIVTRALAHELEQTVSARIHKIHQPSPHDVIFHVRFGGANHKLLISANPTYPRVHFTEQTFSNPAEPPMFCMLMRKYCEGGFVERVEQVGMERIIHMYIRQRDELGDESVKKLIIELTGRHSNIILIDPATNQIIDGIHHVTPSISSYRIVMPGFGYVEPPEQQKANPLEVDFETFEELWQQTDGEAHGEADTSTHIGDGPNQLAKWLVQHMSGISPRIANEWQYRAEQGMAESRLTRSWNAFHALMESVRLHQYVPTILEDEAEKVYFSALPITHIQGKSTQYEAMSTCMEAFYGEKAIRDMVKQRVGDLTRFLQQERVKNEKKLKKLQETLDEAQDADKYRIMGELLFASLHQLKRGDSTVELVNYYDENGGTMHITLDPLLHPSDNAQRYFKKYNKAKNSMQVVEEQMAAARKENDYYDILLQQLSEANVQDAQEIREELIEQGLVRDRDRKSRRKKKDGRPTVYCYTSSEGIPLYVGKNNKQNEYVTTKLANANDTWLHTKDIPGSHVVIRSEQFGDSTLEEAAQLAAYFSQAKHSSQVPVDYTLVRHVRKPNGAKPGFVIYERQKTLYITPDAQRIASMPFQMKQSGNA